jgi:hypothetical protein
MLYRVAFIVCGLGLIAEGSRSQSIAYSPLGAQVVPAAPVRLSRSIRTQLPKEAIAEKYSGTHMTPGGEQVVVYSLNDRHTNPHISIFQNSKLVKDFCVEELADPKTPCAKDDDDKERVLNFFNEMEVPSADSNAAVFSFHNYGDGSLTVLLAVVHGARGYQVGFLDIGVQSQLKYFVDTKTAQLWNGNSDGGCVWCPETYSVTNLRWIGNKLVRQSKFTTRHELDPSFNSDRPILVSRQKSQTKTADAH